MTIFFSLHTFLTNTTNIRSKHHNRVVYLVVQPVLGIPLGGCRTQEHAMDLFQGAPTQIRGGLVVIIRKNQIRKGSR